jgi:hypothetical protein
MVPSSVVNQLRRLRADERGGAAIMMGILMIPLVGFLGLGFEVSNWYMITRGMQNAADAATLAAALNGNPNYYDVEARAVAAQYGFVNGVNNITVSPTNKAACPNGQTDANGQPNCYSVSISGFFPLLMSQVVGFQGNGNINGALQKQLSAFAVAQGQPTNICLLALAGSGTSPAIQTNGAPTGNMNGCNSMSNTAANCNGHNLGLFMSFAVGSNNGCGTSQPPPPPVPPMKDPYYKRISGNISAAGPYPCNNPPQEVKQGNHYTVQASNQLSGPITLTGSSSTTVPANTFWCGDYELTADVTVTTTGGAAVLYIENGQLDLNGHVFQTAGGSALTIVFSGSNTGGYYNTPSDNTNGPGGALNITAPTYGPWAGIAIVQDPSLTTTFEHLNVSAAGNSPTWDITGLIYMPNATIMLKGAIDKSTFGNQCVVMVADNFQISGTGGVMKTDIGQCGQAGLTMPQESSGAQLVQ